MKKLINMNLTLSFNLILTIIITMNSCSLSPSHDQKQQAPNTLVLELVDDQFIYLHKNEVSINTIPITLEKSIKPSFIFEAQPVSLKNILKDNVSIPEDLSAALVKTSIKFERADRYLINFTYQRGKRIVIPYITNSNHVLLKSTFLFDERIDPTSDERSNNNQNFLISRNFMIKIPEKGTYNLYVVTIAETKRDFGLNIQVTANQKILSDESDESSDNPPQSSCDVNLEKNLRNCIPSQCSINITKSFSPILSPPGPVHVNYKIEKNDKICKITTDSPHEGQEVCNIPIEFNPLFQDCLYPSKDPEFAYQINNINKSYTSAKTKNEILELSQKVQNLYIRHYPLSMICLKELDFQFPDFADLLKSYCKNTKTSSNKKFTDWFLQLKDKIALNQSSAQFRFSGMSKSEEPYNEMMENMQKAKLLEEKCFKNNLLKECDELSDLYLEAQDYQGAYEANSHACKLKSGLGCQNAGLALTRLKKRSEAIKYDVKGCELKDGISCYNAACGYCFKNDVTNALTYFKKYLTIGAEDPMHVLFDPTIQCLKNTLEYKQFVKKTLAPKSKF